MKKKLEELLDLYHSDLINKEEYEFQRKKILEEGFFDSDNYSNQHDNHILQEIENQIITRNFNEAFVLIRANLNVLDENQVLIWYTCLKYKVSSLDELTEKRLSSRTIKKIIKDKTIPQIDLSNEYHFNAFYEELLSNHSKSHRINKNLKKNIIQWIIPILGLISALLFGLFSFSTPVESINLSATQVRLIVGETLQVNATASPADADFDGFTWSSENTSIVTVTQRGLLTAVGAGTTIVFVSAGDQTGLVQVTVQARPADPDPVDPVDPVNSADPIRIVQRYLLQGWMNLKCYLEHPLRMS